MIKSELTMMHESLLIFRLLKMETSPVVPMMSFSQNHPLMNFILHLFVMLNFLDARAVSICITKLHNNPTIVNLCISICHFWLMKYLFMIKLILLPFKEYYRSSNVVLPVFYHGAHGIDLSVWLWWRDSDIVHQSPHCNVNTILLRWL